MSKRKREAIERQANITGDIKLIKNDESGKSSVGIRIGWKHRWRSLSFQGKLLTVLTIGLLSLGTFGAGLKYLDERAKQTIAQREAATSLNPSQEGLLAKINPFVPPSPTPTPVQLSKEYIYAGSRLLAVEDGNANAAPPADLAVWRPSTGTWWVMGGGQGSQQVSAQWGAVNDQPVPGDYDGDGKTDFSVFRPDNNAHTGTWYVLYSSSNSWTSFIFGIESDMVVPADYDGDGKTDAAVWRATDGFWYIYRSSDGGVTYMPFGSNGDVPSPGDYDGDGKADAGVWRSSNTAFYSLNSSNQAVQTLGFTQSSNQPVSADYDGDGRADYAIRNSNNWIIRYSLTGVIQSPIPWQVSGDIAVQNDYDGDGKVDIAVWNNTNGTWYIRQSSLVGQSNELRQVQWGTSDDIPVPAFYRR